MMTAQVSVDALRAAVEASWVRDTSSDPQGWTPENPALGQCAVTALVVQHFLGGELLRAVVGDVSHYWNVLPDGSELDLTRQQFEDYSPEGEESRSRGYALSFPDTQRRYERLMERVLLKLEEQRD